MAKKDDDNKTDPMDTGESKFFTKPKPTAKKRTTATRPNTKKTPLKIVEFTKDTSNQETEKNNAKMKTSPAQDRRITMQMMEQCQQTSNNSN